VYVVAVVTKSQCYSFLYLLSSSLVKNFTPHVGRPEDPTGRPEDLVGRPVGRLGRPVGRPEDLVGRLGRSIGRPGRKSCWKTRKTCRKTQKTCPKTGRPVGRLGKPVGRLERLVERLVERPEDLPEDRKTWSEDLSEDSKDWSKDRKTCRKTRRPVGRLGRPVGRPEDPESYKRWAETCSGFSFEAENRSVKIVYLQKRPAEDSRRIRLQRQRRCYTKLAVLLIAGCYNKEAVARIMSFKVVGSFCIKSWIESKSPSKSSCCLLSDVRQQRRL